MFRVGLFLFFSATSSAGRSMCFRLTFLGAGSGFGSIVVTSVCAADFRADFLLPVLPRLLFLGGTAGCAFGAQAGGGLPYKHLSEASVVIYGRSTNR